MVKSFNCIILLIFRMFIDFTGSSTVVSPFSISPPTDVWKKTIIKGKHRSRHKLQCERPSVYICQVPPDTIGLERTKQCNYRNMWYHEQVYRWVAGRGCLLFTPDFMFRKGYNNLHLDAACLYGNLYAPCLEVAKENGQCACYPFDPNLEPVAKAIREALIPAASGRWESCYYEAQRCCSHQTNDENFTGEYCPTSFDGWTCWESSAAGNKASEVCADLAYFNTGPTCQHFSHRDCYNNGTWEINTDYTSCSTSSRFLTRHHYHIAFLTISSIISFPAVLVFCFYKKLRETKVVLRRNLLISVILRNLAVTITRTEIYIDEVTNTGYSAMSTHNIACRILAVLEKMATNAVYVLLFIEGTYLHQRIFPGYTIRMRHIYWFAAVITITPVLIWATTMAYYNNHSCWLVYTVPSVQWALDGPALAILLLNSIIFIDIVRILVTQLNDAESLEKWCTTKTSLFLVLLFWLQYLLTALSTDKSNCTVEELYYYITYAIESFQGILISFVDCYGNKEVSCLLRQSFAKAKVEIAKFYQFKSKSDAIAKYPGRYKGNLETTIEKRELPEINSDIVSSKSNRLTNISSNYEAIDPNLINQRPALASNEYNSPALSEDDTDSIKYKTIYTTTIDTSTASVDSQDWVRCISSPPCSIYNESLNDFEIKYLENKFSQKFPQKSQRSESLSSECTSVASTLYRLKEPVIISHKEDVNAMDNQYATHDDSDMLYEILQVMDSVRNKE